MTPATSIAELAARARAVRRAVVGMAHAGRTPHVGSALSCVDVLVALYFHAFHADPAAPRPDDEDRFIMSKGHGCMAHYATLAERGYFPAERLAEYARDGGALAEHPAPRCVPGIEVATGSLGHGPAIATGLAMARERSGRPGRVFVLVSDGECNEGSVWEAAMFAAGQRLDRLTVIVDYNGLQAMGRCDDITALHPLADKWRAFGWATREVDGHDLRRTRRRARRAAVRARAAERCWWRAPSKGRGLVHGGRDRMALPAAERRRPGACAPRAGRPGLTACVPRSYERSRRPRPRTSASCC